MHAYLILGHDRGEVNKRIGSLCNLLKLPSIPFNVKGIADIKEVMHFVSLKREPSAIVLNNFDEVSTEAQNSFLKTLEEPKGKTVFILTAKSSNSIVPTVISRCVVDTGAGTDTLDPSVLTFLALPKGQQLLLLSKIKDREEAKEFCSKTIAALHSKMISLEKSPKVAETTKIAKAIRKFAKTHQALVLNGNVTLQLASLAIDL